MTEVVDISAGYEKQIRQAVIRDRRRRREIPELVEPASRIMASRFPDRAVILDAALAAATHSLTGASSCLATVCRWDITDEEYKETDLQITVWNHSESTDHAENTFGVARNIDGHYHFFGDCGAMISRGGD